MKKEFAKYLCTPEGHSLDLEVYSMEGDNIIDGRLIDQETGDWYRIENGIADLMPIDIRRESLYENFCSKYSISISPVSMSQERSDTNYEEQINFFKNYHISYEKDVVESPFYKILDNVTLGSWIKKQLKPGQTVLEIGCGSARQTLPLLENGINVVGIDLSEEMLQLAQKKVFQNNYPGKASFIVGSAEMLPINCNSFDAAIIYGSLHHFSDPAVALKDAAEKVKPGGRFYLLEPHNSPVRFLFDWLMNKLPLWEEEAADEPLFDAKQFSTWLASSKFETRIKYSTYLPPHIFYKMSQRPGEYLLSISDTIFSAIPGIRKLAGVIIAEGVKK